MIELCVPQCKGVEPKHRHSTTQNTRPETQRRHEKRMAGGFNQKHRRCRNVHVWQQERAGAFSRDSLRPKRHNVVTGAPTSGGEESTIWFAGMREKGQKGG